MDLQFVSSGRSISETDIAEAESAIGATLPADYRAFLLQYNGGEIEPALFRFTYQDDGDDGEGEITSFQSIGADDPPADLVSTVLFQRDELDLPKHLVPIAFCNEDEVLLAVSGDDAGKVYYWYMIESGFDGDHFEFIANSFQQFLDGLEPAEADF